MECKEKKYAASVTEGESLSEAPFAHEVLQPDNRSGSAQSNPSSSSKVSRDEIPELSTSANEERFESQREEGSQIQEDNEQARFIVSLTNMLPKFIATIPPCFVGARDKRKLDTWLFKVEHYLDLIQVKTERLRINIATTLFDGFAADWWHNRTKHVKEGRVSPVLSWEQFVHIMEQTFVPAEARFTIQEKLAVLKQTGSVPSYIANFLSLAVHFENSSESEKVSRFIDGLKPTPAFYLSSKKPTNMLEAIKFAEKWAYTCAEEGEVSPWKRRKVETRSTSPSKADRQPPHATNINVEGNNHPTGFKRLTEAEMIQYRKRGLCFNCGGHGHTFFQCSQRFLKPKRLLQHSRRVSLIRGFHSTNFGLQAQVYYSSEL
uniref:CCHC-type domain-containing protein n=1 Tax=Physcomitrium patens TaxID=3218 RepID=A0A2K1IR47_PHYPA|nr:hypothetical protein PHYPA_025872 [Physcomitrium patens]